MQCFVNGCSMAGPVVSNQLLIFRTDLIPMVQPAISLLHPRSLQALGLLTGLAIILRFFTFFRSVIDHDESTYIVIADALLYGDVYFRDVIDTKPIGIFGLFALFLTVFGKSIFMIRL